MIAVVSLNEYLLHNTPKHIAVVTTIGNINSTKSCESKIFIVIVVSPQKKVIKTTSTIPNNNILVLTEGVYDITFDSYSKMITITAYTESADTLDIYIKGSGVNGWNHNFSADYRFTLSEDETSYELTVTFTANDDFGIEVFNKGVTEGIGAFKKTGAIGTAGNANNLFVPEGGGDVNFICSVAGTYRIVYNISADTVDFYTVS